MSTTTILNRVTEPEAGIFYQTDEMGFTAPYLKLKFKTSIQNQYSGQCEDSMVTIPKLELNFLEMEDDSSRSVPKLSINLKLKQNEEGSWYSHTLVREEVKMAKTYSNAEVMESLERNRELKFTCQNKDTGKVYEVGVSNNDIRMKSDRGMAGMFSLKDKWTLIPNEYTFIEAINSGKRIKSFDAKEYKTINYYLLIIGNGGTDKARKLIYGKWNIEEVR